MQQRIRLASVATSAGLLAVGFIGSNVQAAQPAATVQAAVEEVLVTARRREESLQDVPIAISAFGGADLNERGVQQMANMNAVAPNLSVAGATNNEGQASFRVRGMPGVSVYIDGVNQATTEGLFTMSVIEVDRIEVLRGPQGTLFGNASLGGAVHYITRPPGDTFSTRVQGAIGSYSRRDIQAAIDLPLSDTFKTKFTVASQRRDGFIHSTVLDRSYGDINDELYRADFLWEPLDSLRVRYNIEVSDTDRAGSARVNAEVGPITNVTIGGRAVSQNPKAQIYANIGIPFDSRNITSGYPDGVLGEYQTQVGRQQNGLVFDHIRHSLDAGWDINDTFSVRAISGYKEVSLYYFNESDGSTPVNILQNEGGSRNFSFSQEVQLLGNHDRFNWVLGGFYERQYNRARSNQRVLQEFTCDLWADADIANRRVTIADQAGCFNLRARAVGVTSLVADPNMTRTQIQGLNTQLATLNPVLNGVDLTAFSGAPASSTDRMTITPQETRAIFGDLTWRLTDRMTLALGLRYSKDESDGSVAVGTGNFRANLVSHTGLNIAEGITDFFDYRDRPAYTNPTEFDALTKRITLQYQWTPDMMTYIGYADGYQPGGVSLLNQQAPGLLTIGANGVATAGYMRNIYNQGLSDVPLVINRDEQTVDSFEIGLRADWLGGALRTNVTAFYTDWRNVPTSQYVATMYWDTDFDGFADSQLDVTGDGVNDPFVYPLLFTTAVDKAEASGVEIEAIYRKGGLRLNLNVGYLKTEYKELGAAGLGILPSVKLGTPFQGAPEYTASFGAQYDFSLASGVGLTPRIDYTFTDDYALQPAQDIQRIQRGFGLLNARLTYDAASNWSVTLMGTNLTDERYKHSGLYSRADQVFFTQLGRPREWGLEFNFAFD